MLSRCSWRRERRDGLDRVAGQELQQDGREERDHDQHDHELRDPSQDGSQLVLASFPTRRTPIVTPCVTAYLLTQMPETGAPVAQTRERTAAVGQVRAEQPVHVRLTRDRPDRVRRPDVPQLVGEPLVEVLVDRLALALVERRATLVEELVDLGVVEPAEVDGVGEVPGARPCRCTTTRTACRGLRPGGSAT